MFFKNLVSVTVKGNARKINFCQWCGGATKHEIPDGEEKVRAICTVCDRIAYENPKMVCCSSVYFAMEISLSYAYVSIQE